MVSIIILLGLGLFTIYVAKPQIVELSTVPQKISNRVSGLWDIAHQGMKENRLLRAEKALLTILNIDKKNAAAYNRLGILYAKQKEYKDAIDCFEIASSIEPTASSLHNLGLIYYDTEHYEKSEAAFELALKLEEDLAARHIAFAKVNEKLGNHLQMIKSLERAVELEPSKESLSLLYQSYVQVNMDTEAKAVRKKLESWTGSSTKKVKKKPLRQRVKRQRRVVV